MKTDYMNVSAAFWYPVTFHDGRETILLLLFEKLGEDKFDMDFVYIPIDTREFTGKIAYSADLNVSPEDVESINLLLQEPLNEESYKVSWKGEIDPGVMEIVAFGLGELMHNGVLENKNIVYEANHWPGKE